MKIDNTMFSMYKKCELMYFERYEADQTDVQRPSDGRSLQEVSEENQAGSGGRQLVVLGQPHRGIELDAPSEGRDFGTRMHQLLDIRRRKLLRNSAGPLPAFPEWPDEAIEAEAQATLAAYEAHWVRDYEYLESERTHILELPARCPDCWHAGVSDSELPEGMLWCNTCNRPFHKHQLIVKLDAVVRHDDGTIGPFDTKTESRQGYNTREDWAGRTQAKIYLYALDSLYPLEKVSRLVVDVVSRGSPKARRGPLFYRHDDIASTPSQIEEAIHNVCWVAEDIERSRKMGWWRSNMNMCKRGWERCDYYSIHVDGRTDANLRKYKPAEQYLDL